MPQLLSIAKDLTAILDISIMETMDDSEGATATEAANGNSDLTQEVGGAGWTLLPALTTTRLWPGLRPVTHFDPS